MTFFMEELLHNTRAICTLLHTNLSSALSTIVLTMFATLLNDFNSLITFSDIPFVGRGLEIPLLPDNRLLISLGAHSYIAINHGHVSEIAGVLLLLLRQSFIYFLPCSALFRTCRWLRNFPRNKLSKLATNCRPYSKFKTLGLARVQ